MNKKDFNRCIEIAQSEYEKLIRLNDYSSYLHWSFIYQNKQLLGWSTNRKADSFVKFGYEPGRRYDHAEPRAYCKCRGLLDVRYTWTCFNVRLNRSRQPAMARPCSICSSFLYATGCGSVYYTDGQGVSKLTV